jgi:hypothetical protein
MAPEWLQQILSGLEVRLINPEKPRNAGVEKNPQKNFEVAFSNFE